MKIVISAGPTREAIDPVRYITNHSSGKMGYALAEAAIEAGHTVILVSGPVVLSPPEGLAHFIPVVTAAEMAEAMKSTAGDAGCVIMTAAVADYRPKHFSPQKVKKQSGDLLLELERTEDILSELGKHKPKGQILVGFAAETDAVEQYAVQKLNAKNLDWIAANDLSAPGCGFQGETNAVLLLSRDGIRISLPLNTKKKIAHLLLKEILK